MTPLHDTWKREAEEVSIMDEKYEFEIEYAKRILSLLSDLEAKEAENLKLREALAEVNRLIHDLPSGVDERADANNPSPEDMVAHIGGLIHRVCQAST